MNRNKINRNILLESENGGYISIANITDILKNRRQYLRE